MSGFVYSLRKFHGRLYNKSKNLKNNLFWRKFLSLPFGKKVYLIGTPEHPNIGDSAIVLAEINFISKYVSSKKIKEITEREFPANRAIISKYVKKEHLICGLGGGNIGNQWYNHELLRYDVLSDFISNNTVIFPQTIYFTPDDKGEKALEESYSHYNNHKNLTIVAREKKSYDLLNQYYSIPQKMLTPDIVLSSMMDDYGVKPTERNGVLLVFRSDEEKSMSDNVRNEIILNLEFLGESYKITDMQYDSQINKDNRFEVVKNKMNEFASSKLVITDRLHGMVFAAVTETPCIVFSNYNHKVKGTYEWIKYLPYIKYVDSINEAKEVMPELLEMKDCKFDNKPLLPYFDELAEVIKQYVN